MLSDVCPHCDQNVGMKLNVARVDVECCLSRMSSQHAGAVRRKVSELDVCG